MQSSREPIYKALFDLVSRADGLQTKSRRFKHFSEVPAEMQPALYQVQRSENAITETGQPTKWNLNVDLYLYVHAGEADDTPPTTQLNPIIDYITNLFDPNPVTGKQTLGGLVHYARIAGNIETDEGLLGAQGIAIIPVEIFAV